jgi:beta-mannosidase
VADPSGVKNSFKLSIKSRFLARAVWIGFGPLDVDLDDNSMDMHAGDEVLIPFRSAASLQLLQEHLTLRSLVDSTLR